MEKIRDCDLIIATAKSGLTCRNHFGSQLRNGILGKTFIQTCLSFEEMKKIKFERNPVPKDLKLLM